MGKNSPHRQPQPSKELVLLLDLDRSEFLKCACFINYAVCRVLRVLFKNLTKLLDSVGFKNVFRHLCTFESIFFFFNVCLWYYEDRPGVYNIVGIYSGVKYRCIPTNNSYKNEILHKPCPAFAVNRNNAFGVEEMLYH